MVLAVLLVMAAIVQALAVALVTAQVMVLETEQALPPAMVLGMAQELAGAMPVALGMPMVKTMAMVLEQVKNMINEIETSKEIGDNLLAMARYVMCCCTTSTENNQQLNALADMLEEFAVNFSSGRAFVYIPDEAKQEARLALEELK
jgi:hypothetical protein